MILLLGGIKGGSGKTTVAVNLSVMLSLDGADVLLVDADEQETASDFTVLRNETRDPDAGYTAIKLTGAAVRTEVQRLAPKYDHVVIDTGGRDTTSQRAAITVADRMLVPFVPRSFDIWTLNRVLELIGEMSPANPGLEAHAFLNRSDPRGSDNGEAAGILSENETMGLLNAPLGNRKAFANAAAFGQAVVEYRPKDQKAVQEIQELYRSLFNVIKKSEPTLIRG